MLVRRPFAKIFGNGELYSSGQTFPMVLVYLRTCPKEEFKVNLYKGVTGSFDEVDDAGKLVLASNVTSTVLPIGFSYSSTSSTFSYPTSSCISDGQCLIYIKCMDGTKIAVDGSYKYYYIDKTAVRITSILNYNSTFTNPFSPFYTYTNTWNQPPWTGNYKLAKFRATLSEGVRADSLISSEIQNAGTASVPSWTIIPGYVDANGFTTYFDIIANPISSGTIQPIIIANAIADKVGNSNLTYTAVSVDNYIAKPIMTFGNRTNLNITHEGVDAASGLPKPGPFESNFTVTFVGEANASAAKTVVLDPASLGEQWFTDTNVLLAENVSNTDTWVASYFDRRLVTNTDQLKCNDIRVSSALVSGGSTSYVITLAGCQGNGEVKLKIYGTSVKASYVETFGSSTCGVINGGSSCTMIPTDSNGTELSVIVTNSSPVVINNP